MASPGDTSAALDRESPRRALEFAAELIRTFDSDAFLPTLTSGMREEVHFDNFIVYGYRAGFAAELIHSNLDMGRLTQQMQPYIDGLYLLDPFYVAETGSGRSGFLALRDVAPDDFEQSEFYLTFYAAVNVLDELHYVVPLGPGRSVHLFVEREPPRARFSDDEIARLDALTTMVVAAAKRHWAWRDQRASKTAAPAIDSAGGIEGVIRNMSHGQLTPREAEVIGLLLRGHSSKLIASDLRISEGTVTNHKRNVYEKLAIHSQAQLFSLFLKALAI